MLQFKWTMFARVVMGKDTCDVFLGVVMGKDTCDEGCYVFIFLGGGGGGGSQALTLCLL